MIKSGSIAALFLRICHLPVGISRPETKNHVGFREWPQLSDWQQLTCWVFKTR